MRVGRGGFDLETVAGRVPLGRSSELAGLLYPIGVRSLTFREGLADEEVEVLLTGLAAQSSGDDLFAQVGSAAHPHILFTVHDPFRRGGAPEPLLAPVVERAQQLAGGVPVLGDGAERFFARLPAMPPVASRAGAALRKRAELLSASAVFMRAADAARWAANQERGPSEAALSRFEGNMVQAALQQGNLEAGIEVVTRAGGGGLVSDDLSLQLSGEAVLGALVEAVESRGLEAKNLELGAQLLMYLTSAAVPGVCASYGTLAGKDRRLRQMLAVLLIDRVQEQTDAVIGLTLHGDARIAKEAMKILGQHPSGKDLVLGFSRDAEHAGRAALAEELLYGGRPRGPADATKLLEVLTRGPDKDARLQAARSLSGAAGDTQVFAGLSNLVRGKEFLAREEDEIDAVLDALTQAGGLQAAPVLEALASRRSGFGALSKGTRRIAKSATDRLGALKSRSKQARETRRLHKSTCSRCLFKNVPQATSCLQCGGPLDDAPKAASGRMSRSGSGRVAVADATGPAAWLYYPQMNPVALRADKVTTIGRSEAADLVLVHESVSRTHAMIRVLGGEMTLEDRSSYGTWINGDRVLTGQLKPGDMITIGPYDLRVEAQRPQADQADTQPLRTLASSEAIGGRLERVSLPEVLQQIEFNQKTGTLEVFCEGQDAHGTLVVYEGRPVYAEMGELQDLEAVIHMVGIKRGNFSFRDKVEAGEMRMSTTLTSILLEASRQIDEGG